MLMGLSTLKEASAFLKALNLFSLASGTSINPIKSLIFFFHAPLAMQINISRTLGFHIGFLPYKFLGAPLIDTPLKNNA